MVELLKKNKELVLNLIITFAFATILTILMCNSKSLTYDTIWCFHSAQKVANGYTMYTEINTVLTPVFFWIGALFIKIFGNAVTSLYICSGIISGIVITTVYNILKKVDKEKSGILFLAFVCLIIKNISIIATPSYNMLALLWWFLAIFLELKNVSENKNKIRNNIFIGILTALAIFTKQSIGIFTLVSTIIITVFKNKVDNVKKIKEELLSKILGVLLVIFPMLIYFILTDSFFAFVNFCIGGLLDFGTQNTIIQIPLTYLIIPTLTILGIVFSEKTRDKILIILTITQICMTSLILPVSNIYHLVLSMLISIPLLGGIIKNVLDKEKYKIIFMMFVFCILCVQGSTVIREEILIENLFMSRLFGAELLLAVLLISFCGLIIIILLEKEKFLKYFMFVTITFLFSIQLFLNYELRKNENISDELNVYKGLNFEEEASTYLEEIIHYIKLKEREGYEVLVVSVDSSYYMAPLGRNNYIYDFALYGSLGFKGEKVLIEQLPKDDNLLIMKSKYMMYQESKMLDEFIKKNFKKVDEIYDLEVYQKNI